MRLLLSIARRYLFAKKSRNAINLITWVCMLGIGFGTMAIILVLSVFNGLTGFIEGLFAGMDPDIKVVAERGQTFEFSQETYDQLLAHPDVEAITTTLEGRVWLEYADNQSSGLLKGVEPNFLAVNQLDSFIIGGNYTFAARNGTYQAVMGVEVAHRLNADLVNDSRPLSEVAPIGISYIPQNASASNPQAFLNTRYVYPAGVFSIQKEYDESLILSDIEMVRKLFDLENEISAYELRLTDLGRATNVRDDLQEILGEDFRVLTWFEQHQTLYRVMKNEKYISYLILVLMLAIAAVNIVGSLHMIVMEKTRDIAVLKSMGATDSMIRRIFQLTGMLVGGIGGIMGVLLALIVGLIQQFYGVVKLTGGESFRVKAFPIGLQWDDFALVFLTVMLLAVVASYFPSRQASRVKVVEGIRL
ncbi:MAG: ABC transporter permease [Bacteroidota bacterium]